MLDRKDILTNFNVIVDKLKLRGFDVEILDNIKKLEEKRKILQQDFDSLNLEKNEVTRIVAEKGKNKQDNTEEKLKIREISNQINVKNNELNIVLKDIENILLTIPNIPDDDVPFGVGEEENVEIRKWGKIPNFNFQVREHDEIGEILEGLDFKEGVNLAKSRFVVMKGFVAKLHRALAQFMLDRHVNQNGYTEVNVPQIVNRKALIGTGQLPKFEEDLFQVEEDMFLIPTAEVPLTNLAANRIIPEKELPIKYVAHSNCYRKEAGSYGKDVKGMIRQHQFEKVELVQIVKPEESEKALLDILNNAEEILQLLELPYRVVKLCTGDLGFGARKTYDIEVWIPSQNKYREISSCSNTGNFQAKRMKSRYKDGNNKDFVHTLNGSGLAVGRTLVAVLENYQNEDGTIEIPEILKPYFD